MLNATASRKDSDKSSYVPLLLPYTKYGFRWKDWHQFFGYTVKPIFSRHSQINETKILMAYASLMTVKSIAECSPWSILQYFWPALMDNWSWKPILVFFLSGRLRQILHLACVPNEKSNLPKVICLFVWLIWFFTSHQQSFSYKGSGLPGLNQY